MLALILDFQPRPFVHFKKRKFEVGTENHKEVETTDEGFHPGKTSRTEEKISKTTENGNAFVIRTKYKDEGRLKKKIPFLIVGIIVLVSAFWGYSKITAKNCMEWHHDRYIAVDCNKFEGNTLFQTKIPRDDNIIKYFRKIKVNCNTKFFDEKGNPLVWYRKMQDGSLEYFTQPGFHPVNGKQLNPITYYIIQKYVC